MTTIQRCTIVLTSVAVALLCPGTAGAATDTVMIPAAGFVADGTNPFSYINYGDSIETGTTLHFQAWLKLPNMATITNVDMMTLDDDDGTITMYLKRTLFGSDGGTETLLTFTSPGNLGCSVSGGLCHDMESLLDIKVDTANYAYWFDLVVPDAAGSPPTENDLAFYAVRIMYDYDDLIFADTFESSNTIMWSNGTASKSNTMAAESWSDDVRVAFAKPTAEERLASFYDTFPIADPVAREAVENALLGKAGFGSPYIIPGPAFKTEGYTEYDDYYLSESFGYVYGRPAGDGDAILAAPVNLPNGAEISFYFAFYVDSVRYGIQEDIRFWLSRMDATDIIPTINMVYEVTSGRDTDIESIVVNKTSMEAVETGCTTIDNNRYSYWVTIDVGPYDLSPPEPYQDEDWWHKVYAIMILYTIP